ncbi:MAG: helicase, partial [Bacteroidota bacterium]
MTGIAQEALRFINTTSVPLFLTGKAGTGKTTFLKNLAENTHKSFIVVAPTGIAALNAGGVTIHSQFQLPFGMFIPDRDLPLDEFNGGNQYNQRLLA